MFPNRHKGISRLHFLLQHVIVVMLVWIFYLGVNWGFYQGALAATDYALASLLLIASGLAEFLTRTSRFRHLSGLSKQQLSSIGYRQTLFALVGVFGTMVMTKDDALSRIFLLVFFTAYFFWVAWSNLFGYRLLHQFLYSNRGKGMAKTLLVGSPAAVSQFWSNPQAPRLPGTEFCGYIPVGPERSALRIGLPNLGDFGDLRLICEESNARALLLLGLNDRQDLVTPVTRMSTELGLRTMWIDDVKAHFGAGHFLSHSNNFSVVSQLREPLEDPTNRMIKRGFDLVFSLIGILLVLPPAVLFVSLLHLFSSRGPLFYTQPRSGRNGETFEVLKFRSMKVDPVGEFAQATTDDQRIFPGGNLIRKFSIDELPQLINVFQGQMSIVGPRPHPLLLDERLAGESHLYRMRNLAKPGITGLAQSRGWRGETRLPNQVRNRIRLDIFYIQNWSLAFDIRIICETLWQVIKPPNSAG